MRCPRLVSVNRRRKLRKINIRHGIPHASCGMIELHGCMQNIPTLNFESTDNFQNEYAEHSLERKYDPRMQLCRPPLRVLIESHIMHTSSSALLKCV